MLLEFAETQDKQPVHISRVRPGLTRDLFCPAYQQRVKANTRAVDPWIPVPHFAHVGAVCHYIQQYTRTRHIRVPFYRDFEQSHHDRVSPLVPPTKLPPATLPLAELYTLQQEAIKQEFVRFHAEFIRPQAFQEPPVSLLTDLKLFEWTIEKFSLFTLYFVEIHQPTGIIYHIGSSDQPEEVYFTTLREELFFIARFPVGNIQAISPLLALPQMASVEFYVQHRFREYRYHFTEEHRLPDYFSFSPGELEQVLAELKHLRYVTNTRRAHIKAGMQRAKASRKQLGRPLEISARFLRKKKSQEIGRLLQKGLGVREVHRRTGYAINTVRKVRNLLLNLNNP